MRLPPRAAAQSAWDRRSRVRISLCVNAPVRKYLCSTPRDDQDPDKATGVCGARLETRLLVGRDHEFVGEEAPANGSYFERRSHQGGRPRAFSTNLESL